jgi:hypothetical protein
MWMQFDFEWADYEDEDGDIEAVMTFDRHRGPAR